MNDYKDLQIEKVIFYTEYGTKDVIIVDTCNDRKFVMQVEVHGDWVIPDSVSTHAGDEDDQDSYRRCLSGERVAEEIRLDNFLSEYEAEKNNTGATYLSEFKNTLIEYI